MNEPFNRAMLACVDEIFCRAWRIRVVAMREMNHGVAAIERAVEGARDEQIRRHHLSAKPGNFRGISEIAHRGAVRYSIVELQTFAQPGADETSRPCDQYFRRCHRGVSTHGWGIRCR